jgi:putative two-component system response regulator
MDFITKPANTEILTHRIDLHIEFSDYQQNLENMIRELEDNIVFSFAELVDCKDKNLAQHVIHTGEFAELLTKELIEAGTFKDELSYADVDLIKRATPLHDIGKIGISDLLLLKGGPLIESEYDEVKKHTLIGGTMLEHIYSRTPNEHYLKLAALIAEGHHERFDGKGYPRGIKGDEIPISCRIIQVVNVYCSCLIDKIYRKGMSHEKACQVILDGRGTEFDPKIVDVFYQNKDKFAAMQQTSSYVLPQYFEWSSYHEADSGS